MNDESMRRVMVDRESRDAVLAAMDDFLWGRIRSFEFDDRLVAIESKDETVSEVRWLVWQVYDDLIDHRVKLTRQAWNYCQRLRLILLSDARLQRESDPKLESLRVYGIFSLAVIAVVAWYTRLGWEFWAIDFMMGIGWAVVMRFFRHEKTSALIPASELLPFENFSSLRAVFESAPTFKKAPYPGDMDLTPLRSGFTIHRLAFQWLFFWPALVAIHLLLSRRTGYSVKLV